MVGIVGISLAWRIVRYSLGMPVWGDEAYVAVDFAIRDFAEMIKPQTYGQIVPLGFMWAELAVVRVMGLTEYALRLLPFLVGSAALVAFPVFALRTLPRGAAVVAVAFFAGSYYIARHCVEIKPYSFDLSLAMLLYVLGWSVLQHPRSVGRWAALIVTGAVAVWFSYPSMFVGGAVGMALTARLVRTTRTRGFLTGWAIYGLALCGSALACILLYAQPHAEAAPELLVNPGWAGTFPPITQPWLLPVWFVEVHTGHMFAYPQGGSPPGSIATFLLFCVGATRVWRKQRELFWLLIGPFVLTFIAAALHKYPYGQAARVSQYAGPPICLLAGLGLAMILKRLLPTVHYRRGLIITTSLVAIIPIGGMIRDIVRPYKNPSVKLLHQTFCTLQAESKPTDLWVIYNANEAKVPHAPYLGDIPGRGGQFVFDVLRFAPCPTVWSPPPRSVERSSPDQTIWLLAYRHDIHVQTSCGDVFPLEQWEAYIDAMRERLGEPDHHKYDIRKKVHYTESVEVCRFRPPARR